MTGHAPPTSLTAFLPIAGDPAVLARVMAQDPQGWLPDGGSDGSNQRSLTLRSEGRPQTVSLRISQPWWSGNTLWRTLSWDALDPLNGAHGGCTQLSRLDGELGLHAAPGAVSLILDVRYKPSRAGSEVAILHREARSIAEQLLVDIAAGLSRAGRGVGAPAAANV